MRTDITDAEIEYAEMLLLPPGCHFNDERRAFIHCMESRDVVACPGSGKTTALLAKLLILARKSPFSDGRGICVLTHTNVAMDNIKEKAGVASSWLFQYPNFFGTIQSFVNQFLAAPWYRSEFGRPIGAIENDRYFWELDRLYRHEYGMQWLEQRGGLDALGNYWFNPGTLQVGKNLYDPIERLSKDSGTFKKIQALRKAVLEQGILSYNDAYAIALRYLLKMPVVAQAISARFCMTFLDETQDTNDYQFRVLDAIFRPQQIVIQRIGDPNQAIYHDRVETDGCWSPSSPLHFSDSRRYGEKITRVLNTVRLDDSIDLEPSMSIDSYPPYMITFDNGEEQAVIQAFAYLVEEVAAPLPPNSICKAVGWIGKDNTANVKLCIPSYFPGFDKSHRAKSHHFPNLISYAAFAIQSAPSEGANRFLEIILQGIIRVLNIAGIKEELTERSFTLGSVKHYLKREHEEIYFQFREQIAESFLLALDSKLTPAILRDQLKSMLKSVWPTLSQSTTFTVGDSIDARIEVDSITEHTRNRLVSANGIVIDVGTVHSVKGETHFATLYLETKYQKGHDASRLLDFLKGKRPKAQLEKEHHKQNLKIAHVAFSRPTHLLAFACQSSSIAGHEEDLKYNGWTIRTVSELIANR